MLVALANGFGIYVSKPGKITFIIAISIASTGLVAGIIWATKIWRKKNTLDYISTATSPDLDKVDKEKN